MSTPSNPHPSSPYLPPPTISSPHLYHTEQGLPLLCVIQMGWGGKVIYCNLFTLVQPNFQNDITFSVWTSFRTDNVKESFFLSQSLSNLCFSTWPIFHEQPAATYKYSFKMTLKAFTVVFHYYNLYWSVKSLTSNQISFLIWSFHVSLYQINICETIKQIHADMNAWAHLVR